MSYAKIRNFSISVDDSTWKEALVTLLLFGVLTFSLQYFFGYLYHNGAYLEAFITALNGSIRYILVGCAPPIVAIYGVEYIRKRRFWIGGIIFAVWAFFLDITEPFPKGIHISPIHYILRIAFGFGFALLFMWLAKILVRDQESKH